MESSHSQNQFLGVVAEQFANFFGSIQEKSPFFVSLLSNHLLYNSIFKQAIETNISKMFAIWMINNPIKGI